MVASQAGNFSGARTRQRVFQEVLVKAWKTRWRVRDRKNFPPGSQPSHVIALTTFFGNAAQFPSCPQQLTKELSQVPLRRRTAQNWINNCIPRWLRCQSFTAQRLRSVTSKRWITAVSKTFSDSAMGPCAGSSAAPLPPCANNFGPLSLHWIKRMATVHDEIDNWLAADIHGELSNDERSALHTHLVECAACRKAHQENKVMNKILEETLAHEKPDPAFEQRMLAGFRNRIPQRSGLVRLLVDFMRLRPVQVTAVAAMLVALVQIGRMITGENATALRGRERYVEDVQVSEFPAPASRPGQAGSLAKSGQPAAGRQDLALGQSPPSPPTTVAPA